MVKVIRIDQTQGVQALKTTQTLKISQVLFQSKVGPLYLVASTRGLRGVHWKKQKVPLVKDLKSTAGQEVRILKAAMKQLEEYFTGKRTQFDLPYDVEGTDFQKQVWKELSKIPYGKTLSYRDVAQRIRNKNAFRAVGTANGKNPLSIIVPCHRVIAADGSLGGYAGGLKIKTKLLDLEQEVKHHG